MPGGKLFLARKRKSKLTLKKVDKKIQSLKRLIEIKEKETLSALELTGGTDSNFALNFMQRGEANGQRIGDQITLKKLMVTLHMLIPKLDLDITSTDITYKQTSMRVLAVIDKKNNNSGAAPVISQILKNAGNQFQKIKSQYDYMFVNSKHSIGKYKILYDRVFNFTQNNIQERIVSFSRSLNHKVNFSTNNNDGTDIIDNKVELIFIPLNDDIMIGYSSVIFYADA